MKELVDAGRLYIAQPPLYKLTTKKESRYVTTEAELRQILIDRGVESLSVQDTRGGRGWEGAELRALCEDLRRLEDVCAAIAPPWARVDAGEVVRTWDGTRVRAHLARMDGKDHWFDTLSELQAILDLARVGRRGALRVYQGPGGDVTRDDADVLVCHLAHTEDLAHALASLEQRGLAVRGDGEWLVQGGKEDVRCRTPLQLAQALRRGAQGDVDLQRYKGLGEMDAEQLWESTMDPARRTLYQVTLEDAMKADEIFILLMSDNVEPRRVYIEQHALEVTNLDV
jgi:DNA gyrase subunit B